MGEMKRRLEFKHRNSLNLSLGRCALSLTIMACLFHLVTAAQDTVRYIGNTLVNVDYHHGQLQPVIGVHNIQTMRANREHPDQADGFGWTYNHAPMLVYWNNMFFMQYLSNPVGEHVPPGQTFLQSSKDGYVWSKPVVVFPMYKVPDGTKKEGKAAVVNNLYAVNHQRMGFYVSKSGKLLTLAYYGLIIEPGDDPNDGKGIGRVVREVNKDGSFGPIYFIRYNHAFSEKNTSYPFYTSSKDKEFVKACNEILSSPLIVQQWVEEADRDDSIIPLKRDVRAFSYYHLPDGRVVGLWKHALTTISNDGGRSWQYNPLRAPGFVNSNAKIWGQRTSDGKYATVYNPSEFRWPLAVSVSPDGLKYDKLLLVNGEISSMRYGGNYKSYGPQYVRGIEESQGEPTDRNLWVAYSMNKEDIWISKIPVPLIETAVKHADEVFNDLADGAELKSWNIYSPLWSPVRIEKNSEGKKTLSLQDKDPFDYAKAERIVPATKKIVAEFTITAQQHDHGQMNIEFQDAKGTAGVRLSFDSAGNFYTKAGYRNRNLAKYVAGEKYLIRVELNTSTRFYTVSINGKSTGNNLFFAPLSAIERIVFRTGVLRRFPDADTPTDQMYDLPDPGSSVKNAVYRIESFKTSAF